MQTNIINPVHKMKDITFPREQRAATSLCDTMNYNNQPQNLLVTSGYILILEIKQDAFTPSLCLIAEIYDSREEILSLMESRPWLVVQALSVMADERTVGIMAHHTHTGGAQRVHIYIRSSRKMVG